MPREIRKTVYSFKELSEMPGMPKRAVEHARGWLLEDVLEPTWWDDTFRDWRVALGDIGLHDADIYFSGFSTQGDGASFTSEVDVAKVAAFMSHPPAANQDIDSGAAWVVHKIGYNLPRPAFRRMTRLRGHVDLRIKRNRSNYYHEHTAEIEHDLLERGRTKHPMVVELYDNFIAALEGVRLKICRAIYRDLEEDYLYLTSDANLIEHAEINTLYFDIQGNPE